MASLMIAIVCAATGPASALSDSDLLGNWCGRESNYAFSRKVMIVTRPSDSEKLVFNVVAYEPREDRIAVSWQRGDGKVVRTEFAEFSADRKQMVQLSNSGGPRREFRRC
jgi:hypothetical protein